MTEFLETHPGGRLAILQQAGKDARYDYRLTIDRRIYRTTNDIVQ